MDKRCFTAGRLQGSDTGKGTYFDRRVASSGHNRALPALRCAVSETEMYRVRLWQNYAKQTFKTNFSVQVTSRMEPPLAARPVTLRAEYESSRRESDRRMSYFQATGNWLMKRSSFGGVKQSISVTFSPRLLLTDTLVKRPRGLEHRASSSVPPESEVSGNHW